MTLNSPVKHEIHDDSKPQVITLNSPVKHEIQDDSKPHVMTLNSPGKHVEQFSYSWALNNYMQK